VGDPFKDTSGPSLNILLKLMSVVALVIAPSIAISADAASAYAANDNNEVITQTMKEVSVDIKAESNEDGTVKAVVTKTTTENGETVVTEDIIEGSEKEVNEKLEAYKASTSGSEDSKTVVKEVIKEVKKS
ncbi:MAG: sodium/proton-translocating pyrophosphatase, partial [Winogradskyella sp.]|nr:sodium/proton-translocating pyrophosphatase [Winogradskyella sp.]